jgi:hypothetical protein
VIVEIAAGNEAPFVFDKFSLGWISFVVVAGKENTCTEDLSGFIGRENALVLFSENTQRRRSSIERTNVIRDLLDSMYTELSSH